VGRFYTSQVITKVGTIHALLEIRYLLSKSTDLKCSQLDSFMRDLVDYDEFGDDHESKTEL
jgi:hypothetical protein